MNSKKLASAGLFFFLVHFLFNEKNFVLPRAFDPNLEDCWYPQHLQKPFPFYSGIGLFHLVWNSSTLMCLIASTPQRILNLGEVSVLAEAEFSVAWCGSGKNVSLPKDRQYHLAAGPWCQWAVTDSTEKYTQARISWPLVWPQDNFWFTT